MKKLLTLLAVFAMVLSLGACANNSTADDSNKQDDKTPVVEEFAAEYEMKGTTSAGKPKNDTFIFEGKTTDGVITELNFDIVRNKGLDGEYSKKTLMGYQMNVSDASYAASENGHTLTLSVNSYTDELSQYMVQATLENPTAESTFKDLMIVGAVRGSYSYEVLDMQTSLDCFAFLANEAGVELTEDTLIADLVALHGIFAEGAYVEGSNRVSFAGLNGGRSYGEQIDAIVTYILANNMTLEDVYEMFKTVNQQSEPILERDTISGATIAFVGDFQRMTYLAINGELYEGVTNHTITDGNTKVEVVTQGFGGEIETHVTFDAEGKIVSISVRDAQETDTVGAPLYAEGSDFLNALVAGQADLGAVETVSGATVTSSALIEAVQLAVDYYNGL